MPGFTSLIPHNYKQRGGADEVIDLTGDDQRPLRSFDFGIRRWNDAAKTVHWAKRGVRHDGDEGSFWVYVLFTAKSKGFVVQHIEKTVRVQNANVPAHDKDYYEIFYVGGPDPDGDQRVFASVHADGFVQQGFGPNSSGTVTITGTSYFVRYIDNVSVDKDNNIVMNARLQRIFGAHVRVDGEHDSAGLPYSEKPPDMRDLQEDGTVIVHKVVATWGDGPKPEETQITETVTVNGKAFNLQRPVDYENAKQEGASSLPYSN